MLSTTAHARIVGLNLSARMAPTDFASRIGQPNGPQFLKKFNGNFPDDPPPKKTGSSTNGSGGGSGTPKQPLYDGDWGSHSDHHHGGYGYYNGGPPPATCKGRPC